MYTCPQTRVRAAKPAALRLLQWLALGLCQGFGLASRLPTPAEASSISLTHQEDRIGLGSKSPKVCETSFAEAPHREELTLPLGEA